MALSSCAWCGAELRPPGARGGRPRRYCDRACELAAHAAGERERYAELRRACLCPRCKTQIPIKAVCC